VLVVDDNPVNLMVALRLVELLGYQAEGAANGRVALEALQRRSFAAVLMDCHMPEMDGFEATERIRAMQGELSRTPIVALTASAMPEEVAACRRAGMDSVIAKPLTIEQLRDALAEPLA
jgi:CheY-like chemotaxis protein